MAQHQKQEEKWHWPFCEGWRPVFHGLGTGLGTGLAGGLHVGLSVGLSVTTGPSFGRTTAPSCGRSLGCRLIVLVIDQVLQVSKGSTGKSREESDRREESGVLDTETY